MLKARVRLFGALVLGAALALPLAAGAQAPAADKKAAPAAAAAPATAAPAAAAPAAEAPKPAQGSTAVPGWNNPPSWGSTSERPQYASIPGVDTNRLIQGAGREWREFRNGPLTRYGGWVIAGVLALITLVYLLKGSIKLHGQPTGRMIERFNAVERAAHWTMALSFIVLALSGVITLWGKHIVLPWLGYGAFSWLSIVAKNLHNFVGPLFIFSLVVMFLIYVKDNIPGGGDVAWLTNLGGMFGGTERPSGRFNGGEKAWFWGGLVVLGAVMSVTGLILDFPNWSQGREAMQEANVIHVVAAVLFIAGGLAHAYIGTLGMEGAYQGMRTGFVDETWARQHHSLWYEDVKAGKRPEKIMGGAAQPAMGDD